MFRHPKYYKELRKLRNKLDQAISQEAATAAVGVRPDPGLKLPASEDSTANSTRGPSDVRPDPGLKQQATSAKQQATSRKLQAPSDKPQAPSSKPQA